MSKVSSTILSISFVLVGVLLLFVACVIDPVGGTRQDTDGGVGDECMTDTNCRDLLTCSGGTCQPRGAVDDGGFCELTADCVDGLYCSYARSCMAAGESIEGGSCSSTADCEASLICVLEGLTGRCRVAGEGDIEDVCESDTDCCSPAVCDTLNNWCSCADLVCATDADCCPGYSCDGICYYATAGGSASTKTQRPAIQGRQRNIDRIRSITSPRGVRVEDR